MKATKRELAFAREYFGEVRHTTLNPDSPGVVRIHFVPPKEDYEGGQLYPGVAIINGQDVIPVNLAWSVLLTALIAEINRYSGQPINEQETGIIVDNACSAVKKVYPLVSRGRLRRDIFRIMNTFGNIARGLEPQEDIDYIPLGDYAPLMKAPHRMDLLVSSMSKNGAWHCNQKCVHCYAAGQEAAGEAELPTAEWKNIIDKCRAAGIPQVTFTGGEPTMRDDLPELIEYAGWFVTRLNTNGIKLTKDYCKKLKEASLDSLQITFYSCDEKIHNALVGADGFRYTAAGIDNALAAGLNLSINTPLCTMNRDYVRTLEYLNEKGVIYVTCSGLITTGNAAGEESGALQLTGDEMKETLREAVDYCFSHGMEISFTSPGWVSEDFCRELGITVPTCGACLSNMAVTPGGNVVPCQSWLSGPSLGKITECSWEEIWNSRECVERRRFSAEAAGICPLRVKGGRNG